MCDVVYLTEVLKTLPVGWLKPSEVEFLERRRKEAK